jgi:uncharacterized protein YegP (UPF0339 family)
MEAKFIVYKDKRGEWRFNLEASNGKLLLQSEGYTRKENALKGIESIKKNAPNAKVDVRPTINQILKQKGI